MASTVLPNGEVQPPFNIEIPAPTINLRGFNWGTVDEKVNEAQDSQGSADEAALQSPVPHHSLAQRAAVVPDVPLSKLEATAAPAASTTLASSSTIALDAAPALAPGVSALSSHAPVTLEQQLGLAQAPGPSRTPLFPLDFFKGAYAGNGFNTIWRPRTNDKDTKSKRDDHVLELNFTTEQLTFGPPIGEIPNRGLFDQKDIFLAGLPYLQTVQDVTNPATGLGDNPVATDIHFEPGMWLKVPKSNKQAKGDSIVRMASIPHGTTIHAQGVAPTPAASISSGPTIDTVNITPFDIGQPPPPTTEQNAPKGKNIFPVMEAGVKSDHRSPKILKPFVDSGAISDDIIQNPNLILANAIKPQKITKTITFEVSTGPSDSISSGGGTANISFLQGVQVPSPNDKTKTEPEGQNAHAAFMKSKFWIETVMYKVRVPKLTRGRDDKLPATILLRPTVDPKATAPIPQFAITPKPTKEFPTKEQDITVPGIQIQYSQTVNLNFATLTWPHVSVATLVPVNPQPFEATLVSE